MEWKKLDKRKSELKVDGIVIATIYRKSADMWSLFVATPLIYRKLSGKPIGRTHEFESFEKAQEECNKLLAEKILPWLKAVESHLEGE